MRRRSNTTCRCVRPRHGSDRDDHDSALKESYIQLALVYVHRDSTRYRNIINRTAAARSERKLAHPAQFAPVPSLSPLRDYTVNSAPRGVWLRLVRVEAARTGVDKAYLAHVMGLGRSAPSPFVAGHLDVFAMVPWRHWRNTSDHRNFLELYLLACGTAACLVPFQNAFCS